MTTLTKTRPLAKGVGLSICLGLLYYILLHTNPANALTGVIPDIALLKLRMADLLKPFVMVCPGLAFTIPIASYMHNVDTGRIAFGAYSIMPFASAGLLYATYKASQLLGRGLLKDVVINGVAGILMGIIVSVNITMISNAHELLKIAVSLKCMKIALVFIAGTLILNAIEGMKK